MINSRKQNGSALLVVVIIIVIAILGILGYGVRSTLSNSKSNDSQQQTSMQSEETEESAVEPTDDDYLVLDNWKIKFKLADSLKTTEVLYYARKTNDNPAAGYYAFTTKRIQALGGKCTEQPFGDTVILYRYTEKPIATPDGELINEEALNGYYYILTSPISSCSGFDGNGQMQPPSQVEIDDRTALKESIRKLIAV